MIEIFATDNSVLISRVSALFDAEEVPFVILGHHASLLGGGIMGIGQRVMVDPDYIPKALRLIRENGLKGDIDFVKGLEEG
ncbi:DUF2007 domain-containing protein [Paremcibacter congregatus]|uniref:DUF2007 domain-containing protein n=1 Tax=Paremcibacter congregatus TaxID=2043170 RepID=A0A2G4YUH3_9PROT|nr:DUF2007 domain-containing protein [Paremcibacter congregatus]PHZ85900.1 hypothetical protein CRD36_04285 [Paremcibacter congregatus]QDE26865.1 DUF2007 domain-containing protein [Paremcibacter congregatus]